jgi:hypothetical protein
MLRDGHAEGSLDNNEPRPDVSVDPMMRRHDHGRDLIGGDPLVLQSTVWNFMTAGS